jgi:hypothetical protein
MRRTKPKSRPEPLSPEQELAVLAHRIAHCRQPDLGATFWTTAAEVFLIKLLPLGLDEALASVRAIQSAPDQYSGDLGHMRDWEPKLIHGVLSHAEFALVYHIKRTTMGNYLRDRPI